VKTIAAFLASAITALTGGAATTTPPVLNTHCFTIAHTLSYGSQGTDVSNLQQFLGVKPTGYFGPATQKALMNWQISSGIIHTARAEGAGSLGPKSRAAMRCNLSAVPVKTTPTPIPTPIPAHINTTAPAPTPNPVALPPSIVPSSAGGSGPTSPGSTAAQCAEFTTLKPPDSQCAGTWQKIMDEAGCYVEWDCDTGDAQG
jgi:peptidoglycan hydrolase-like protein with peptidoglycan-binding domain